MSVNCVTKHHLENEEDGSREKSRDLGLAAVLDAIPSQSYILFKGKHSKKYSLLFCKCDA